VVSYYPPNVRVLAGGHEGSSQEAWLH
jgi:hypothetical protein